MDNGDDRKLSQILFEQLSAARPGGNLNFTERRIIKDLEEFETNVDPEMGLSASPLRDNIYEWHCNI